MSRPKKAQKEQYQKYNSKSGFQIQNLHQKMLKYPNQYLEDCAYPDKTLRNKDSQLDALDVKLRGTIGRGNRTAKHAGREYLRHLEIQTRAKGGLMKR